MSEVSSSEHLEEEPRAEVIEYSNEYKDQVLRLINDIAENKFGHHSKIGRPDLEKIEEAYQTDKGNFWVALEENNVVGTVALKDMGDNRGGLRRLYVKKDLRKSGIGKKLFSNLLAFARNNAYEKLFLSTGKNNEVASRFYIENGFERVESLPEDFPHSSNLSIFFALDIKEEK